MQSKFMYFTPAKHMQNAITYPLIRLPDTQLQRKLSKLDESMLPSGYCPVLLSSVRQSVTGYINRRNDLTSYSSQCIFDHFIVFSFLVYIYIFNYINFLSL